jgi:hypothetical protein
MHAMRTHVEEVASLPPMNTSIPLPPHLPVSHTALFPLCVLPSSALLAIPLSFVFCIGAYLQNMKCTLHMSDQSHKKW